MPIQIAQSLIPSTTNTPVDSRTVVASVSNIANIEVPYIGMHIYCTGNGKEYRVTSLKSKIVGALPVPNAQVDQYEELINGGGSSGSSVTTLSLTLPATSEPLSSYHVVVQKYDSGWTTVVNSSSASTRVRVKYFDGTAFATCPDGGIPGTAAGMAVIVDIDTLLTDGNECRMKWTLAGGSASDDSQWYGFKWPSSQAGVPGEIDVETAQGVTPLSPITQLTGTSPTIEPGKAYTWTVTANSVLNITGGESGKTGDSIITIVNGSYSVMQGTGGIEFSATIPHGATSMCAVRWSGTSAVLYVLGSSSMPTIAVGTVASGQNASVVNTGTSTAAVLDFVIPKGDAAPNVMLQYSSNDVSYHSVFADGDCYIRTSVDGGTTWSSGMRFVYGGVTPFTDIVALTGSTAVVQPGNVYSWTLGQNSTIIANGGASGKAGDSLIVIERAGYSLNPGNGITFGGTIPSTGQVMCAVRWFGTDAVLYPLVSI